MLQGYYLIHPMGWDAFGLPAENYAINKGIHPAKATAENIKNIKRQINEIAAIYDWDMEVNTTDPDFYKWTQWIFVKMFKAGLAYEKEFPINWCPSCKTGLANEESRKRSVRAVRNACDKEKSAPVDAAHHKICRPPARRSGKTGLAGEGKEDAVRLDRKSHGAEIDLRWTARKRRSRFTRQGPDTLYGATFMVLAPEHEMAKELATDETREAVEDYIFKSSMKSSVDRLQDKEKTGVFTEAMPSTR